MIPLPPSLVLPIFLFPPAPATDVAPTVSEPVGVFEYMVGSKLAEPMPYANTPLAPRQDDDDTFALSPTYFELGIIEADIDDLDDDLDVWYGKVQIGFLKFLHAFAQYENQEFDDLDIDADVLKLGAGVHFNVGSRFDLYGDVAWLTSDVNDDEPLSDLDDADGYEIHVHGRWLAIPWSRGGLEINGGVTWVDMDDRLASDDEATGFDIGARIHFLRFMSVGGSYEVLEDDDRVLLSARVSF